MNIRGLRNEAGILILELKESLDLHGSSQLKDTVMKLVEQDPRGIIIDMTGVKSIASAGIGALISISSTLQKMDCALAIAGAGGAVLTSLEVSRFSAFLPIVPTLKDAIAKIEEQVPGR